MGGINMRNKLIILIIINLLLISNSFSQEILRVEKPTIPSWEKVIIIPNPETKLSFDLWLNKPEGSIYRVGEELKIFVRANDNVYLYIFDLTPDGEFKLIFPNLYSANNFIRANQTYTFPDKPTYSFKVSPPSGKEYIVGIVSKNPLNLFPGKRLESLRPGETLDKDIEKAMKNIQKILIEEKKENWIQKVTYFYVQEEIIQGKVKINSNPSNAQVYVNNEFKGKTPLSLTLPEGSYRVLVKMDGYRDYQTTIIIEGNREKEYTFNLQPKYGDLRIDSNPQGAYVYIDGSLKGKTPLSLKNLLAKTYEVKLTYSGYQDKVERVEVVEGRETRVSFSLLPLTGGLNILSNPQGAEVYLNGIYKGITPIMISDLSPGNYQVQLRKSGYKDFLTYVTVYSGMTTSYNFTLVPLLSTLNIFSTPSSADVYINEVYKGKTPFIISDLSFGTYNIRISLTGYEDYVESIVLNPGEVKQINVSLKPLYGILYIDSKPQGAMIYIDNKYQGVTPLNINLPEGKYNLTLSLLGYSEINTDIIVKNKEKYNYIFVLSRKETQVKEYYLSFINGGYEGNLIITKLERAFFVKDDKYALNIPSGGSLEVKIPPIYSDKIYLKINLLSLPDEKGNINPIFEILLNGKSIIPVMAVESKDYIILKLNISQYMLMNVDNILSIMLSEKVSGGLKIREIRLTGE